MVSFSWLDPVDQVETTGFLQRADNGRGCLSVGGLLVCTLPSVTGCLDDAPTMGGYDGIDKGLPDRL